MSLITEKIPLLLPVENQVRELDSKILLACIAARRGFSSYIGSRREIHFNITAFPKSVYLSKSITRASDMMFRIMRNLGHKIVAWDEEALVHLPPETYFSRRLDPRSIRYVSHLFSWGEENAELWLRPLQEAGLGILETSDDQYHFGDSTNNPASHAREAAKKLGMHISSICIDDPTDSTLEKIDKGEPVYQGNPKIRGRAAEKLIQSMPVEPV